MPNEPKKNLRPSFFHAFLLALTVFLTCLWVNNPFLVRYNLWLAIAVLFVYFLTKILPGAKEPNQPIWPTIAFVVSLLLLISATGGLGSAFFFLIYFLLFAVSLLFASATTLIFAFSLMLFFMQDCRSLDHVLKLFSLLLMTPLAIYFGKQYLKLLEAQKKIKILAKEGRTLDKTVTAEETDSLLWLSLNFKNGLSQILHQTSELLADLGQLTLSQKEKLQKVHEAAKELLKSGQKLQEKIDRETD